MKKKKKNYRETPKYSYLFSDARKDGEEGQEDGEEEEDDGDGGYIAGDAGAVAVGIECWAALWAEGIKPASHPALAP